MHIRLDALRTQVPQPATAAWPQGVWDVEAMSRGSMSVIYFAPRGRDYQTSHDRDELYVIISGRGVLVVGEQRSTFGAGDVLFVRANDRHHFEDFSDDLATWAVFWGPPGGEAPVPAEAS